MEGQVVEGGEDGGTMEDLSGGDPDPDMDKMIERQTLAFAGRWELSLVCSTQESSASYQSSQHPQPTKPCGKNWLATSPMAGR